MKTYRQSKLGLEILKLKTESSEVLEGLTNRVSQILFDPYTQSYNSTHNNTQLHIQTHCIQTHKSQHAQHIPDVDEPVHWTTIAY